MIDEKAIFNGQNFIVTDSGHNDYDTKKKLKKNCFAQNWNDCKFNYKKFFVLFCHKFNNYIYIVVATNRTISFFQYVTFPIFPQ